MVHSDVDLASPGAVQEGPCAGATVVCTGERA